MPTTITPAASPLPATTHRVRILGIESSCDETAAAIVDDGWRIRSSVVASQTDLHEVTGGVVPEVAARQHLRALVPVVRQALVDAECSWDQIDFVAVTRGPGLPGALLVGLNAARGLAYARGLPLIPADHIEGHVRAAWLRDTLEGAPSLPALALVVSGGHTELLLLHADGGTERIGSTRDDAAGEAFDKVARLLGLPYPGGPPLSRLAAEANIRKLRLPRAWLRGNDDFSFSGLKTATRQLLEGERPPPRAEVAWAFEESVCDVLSTKAVRAAQRLGVRTLLLAGGVAANARLRERVQERAREAGLAVFIPPPALCTDNAAMIAAAAHEHLDEAVSAAQPLDVLPTAGRAGSRSRLASARR